MNLIGIAGWFVNGKILKNDLISTSHYSLYNKIVPVISKVESLVHPPIGLSVVLSRQPRGDIARHCGRRDSWAASERQLWL